MKANLAAFSSGLLFAIGLAIAGMTQPSKVIGFLDFFGDWDPSLMLVMVGAIAVHLVLLRVVLKRRSPLFADAFRIPTRRDLTPQLVIGASLFGVGWGLGGFCPGPAVASVGTLGAHALTFVATMALGMLVHRWVGAKSSD
jgi:uncharacterized membrane protein YedE/YeeE